MSILKSLGYADAKTRKAMREPLQLSDRFAICGRHLRPTRREWLALGRLQSACTCTSLATADPACENPQCPAARKVRPILFGMRYGVGRGWMYNDFMAAGRKNIKPVTAYGYSTDLWLPQPAKPRQWGNPETFHTEPGALTIHVPGSRRVAHMLFDAPTQARFHAGLTKALRDYGDVLAAQVARPMTCNCTNPACPVLRHTPPAPKWPPTTREEWAAVAARGRAHPAR